MANGFGGPVRRLVGVAGIAGVGDFVLRGRGRRNKLEGVRANEGVRRTFGFNLRHVAGDTFAAGAALLVVSVFFDGGSARTVWRKRAVAIEAELLSGLTQLSVVCGAVNIVAIETGDPAGVHHALYEVVALHAVLVSSAFGEVIEILRTERGLFEFPKAAEI